jgi:hypothetical protein
MKIAEIDIFKIVDNWIEPNLDYLKSQGFSIYKEQPTEGRQLNSMCITVDRGKVLSTITIYETGECDFIQVDENYADQNKYFKNIVLTHKELVKSEFDYYFLNFDFLKGSSIDSIHRSNI